MENLLGATREFYRDAYSSLTEGCNADIQKNLKSLAEGAKGQLFMSEFTATYMQGTIVLPNIGSTYTIYFAISAKRLYPDLVRVAEDLTMGFYRTHGGRGYTTMELIHLIKEESKVTNPVDDLTDKEAVDLRLAVQQVLTPVLEDLAKEAKRTDYRAFYEAKGLADKIIREFRKNRSAEYRI